MTTHPTIEVEMEDGSANASLRPTPESADTDAVPSAELLPCPFCGGRATVTRWFWVDGSKRPDAYRASCVFGCGQSRDELTRANAYTAWNRRAPVDLKSDRLEGH